MMTRHSKMLTLVMLVAGAPSCGDQTDLGGEHDGVRQASGAKRYCARYRIDDCEPTGGTTWADDAGEELPEYEYSIDELCWRQQGEERFDYCWKPHAWWKEHATARKGFTSQTSCRQKAVHASHTGKWNAGWHVEKCAWFSTWDYVGPPESPYHAGAGAGEAAEGETCHAHGKEGQCLKTWHCSQRGWKATPDVWPCSEDSDTHVQCCTPNYGQNPGEVYEGSGDSCMSGAGQCIHIRTCDDRGSGWTSSAGHCPNDPYDVRCCHREGVTDGGEYTGTCYSGDREGVCKSSCVGMGKVWVIENICADGKDCCINP